MAVYALSDLHGCLNAYQIVKKLLKPEDKVYFLGDAGDRGKHPWETIKAIARDPQFIYLKGNHEDMLYNALNDWFEDGYLGDNYRHLVSNGGCVTFYDATNDDLPRDWASWLRKLPTSAIYENELGETVYLSHAGFTPWVNIHSGNIVIPQDKKLIWDRDHYLEDFSEDWDDNAIIVHGHTPIPILLEDLNISQKEHIGGALWYANERKLCIDCGTVWTGECVLVNLDTWEEFIFNIYEKDNN